MQPFFRRFRTTRKQTAKMHNEIKGFGRRAAAHIKHTIKHTAEHVSRLIPDNLSSRQAEKRINSSRTTTRLYVRQIRNITMRPLARFYESKWPTSAMADERCASFCGFEWKFEKIWDRLIDLFDRLC